MQITFTLFALALTPSFLPAAIILDTQERLLGNLFFPPRELINAPNVLEFDVNDDGQTDFILRKSANIGHRRISLEDISGTSRFVYSPSFVAALVEGFEIGFLLLDPTKELRFTNQIGSETLGDETQSIFFGEFLEQNTAYLGFEFQADTGTHYGYAKITDQNAHGIIVESVAWESTPGQSIFAGAIPEPTTSLLLGIVGAGSILRRKRKVNDPA